MKKKENEKKGGPKNKKRKGAKRGVGALFFILPYLK